MDILKNVFDYLNHKHHVTSEQIADATDLEYVDAIKALVILTGDKLVTARMIADDIFYYGKGIKFPKCHEKPETKASHHPLQITPQPYQSEIHDFGTYIHALQ